MAAKTAIAISSPVMFDHAAPHSARDACIAGGGAGRGAGNACCVTGTPLRGHEHARYLALNVLIRSFVTAFITSW